MPEVKKRLLEKFSAYHRTDQQLGKEHSILAKNTPEENTNRRHPNPLFMTFKYFKLV